MSDEARRRNTELAREWLHWQRHRRNRARETMFIYTDVLQKLLAWVDDTPWAAVSIQTLEAFVDRPRVRRRPEHVRGEVIIGAPATRKRDVTIIRSFYRHLTDRGFVARNPAALLVAPTVHNVQPKAIDDELWEAFWRHHSLTDAHRVAFGLPFFCGLRRAEVVDLRRDHVDLSRLRLVGFTRKGGLQDTLPLQSFLTLFDRQLPQLLGPDGAESVLAPLRRLVERLEGSEYLLPWGDELVELGRPAIKDPYPAGWCPPNTVNKRLQVALRATGLPSDAFTPHSLRHSAITNWLRAGVPLEVTSRLAAHADIQTTMRYVRTGTDPLRPILDSLELERPRRWP